MTPADAASPADPHGCLGLTRLDVVYGAGARAMAVSNALGRCADPRNWQDAGYEGEFRGVIVLVLVREAGSRSERIPVRFTAPTEGRECRAPRTNLRRGVLHLIAGSSNPPALPRNHVRLPHPWHFRGITCGSRTPGASAESRAAPAPRRFRGITGGPAPGAPRAGVARRSLAGACGCGSSLSVRTSRLVTQSKAGGCGWQSDAGWGDVPRRPRPWPSTRRVEPRRGTGREPSAGRESSAGPKTGNARFPGGSIPGTQLPQARVPGVHGGRAGRSFARHFGH